jgi:hypothetical protein
MILDRIAKVGRTRREANVHAVRNPCLLLRPMLIMFIKRNTRSPRLRRGVC